MSDPIEASLSIELNVECPHCQHYFDLIAETSLNDDGYLLEQACPSNEHWSDAHERFKETVECPSCANNIQIDNIAW